MSFERFSSSDVYMFPHVGGGIECCACFLSLEDEPFPNFKTPREALAHLDRHLEAGYNIGRAKESILEDYKNLDEVIEPYQKDG